MAPLATVGILSIGEMGMGIAKLLIAHGYRVVTNVEGRSDETRDRVVSASIETIPTDAALITESDYILCIVPPRDAFPTAQRIINVYSALPIARSTPLYYLDLNAISPRTARSIASLFHTTDPQIRFLDGGIIGGPPALKENNQEAAPPTSLSTFPPTSHTWSRPSIPLSGPDPLSSAPISGAHLQETLNINHLSPEIGPASGLKCCFATTTKGFTALCIQAFTTASQLGVLEELQKEMSTRIPGLAKASGSVISMPPKAYRWVKEMEEIGITHHDDGGFQGQGKGIFDAVAEVYRVVAEDSVLGEETTESRKRGRTVDDVASAVAEGLNDKRKKTD